jgi:hypothetical protein
MLKAYSKSQDVPMASSMLIFFSSVLPMTVAEITGGGWVFIVLDVDESVFDSVNVLLCNFFKVDFL